MYTGSSKIQAFKGPFVYLILEGKSIFVSPVVLMELRSYSPQNSCPEVLFVVGNYKNAAMILLNFIHFYLPIWR